MPGELGHVRKVLFPDHPVAGSPLKTIKDKSHSLSELVFSDIVIGICKLNM